MFVLLNVFSILMFETKKMFCLTVCMRIVSQVEVQSKGSFILSKIERITLISSLKPFA